MSNWWTNFDGREKPTPREKMFVTYYITNGFDKVAAYLRAYTTENPRTARHISGLLLRQERIRKLIEEELQKQADEAGLTIKFLFKQIKASIEDAVGEKKVAGARLASEVLEVGGMERGKNILPDFKRGLIPAGEVPIIDAEEPKELPPVRDTEQGE